MKATSHWVYTPLIIGDKFQVLEKGWRKDLDCGNKAVLLN